MTIWKAEHLSFSYRTKYQTIHAVQDISCEFDTGKMYAVTGESGSGKTTLLSLLAGLDLPESGKVTVRGNDLSQMLLQVGLAEKIFSQFPQMMSGGEQQRVAIARAFASGGKILLADEPTGNLDTENEQRIVDLLRMSADERGYAVIVITHNPKVAARADVILRMQDGKLVSGC